MLEMIDKDTFLNDVAIRSFRDQADRDYILARISYRNEFYCQYHWSGLQAIEKYIPNKLENAIFIAPENYRLFGFLESPQYRVKSD